MKISLIIPAYNEEGNIKKIYDQTTKAMKEINYDYEIIFINDGSIDNTEKCIIDIFENDEKIKLISFTRNFGHQAALMAGYNNCSGDAAITMDCDLQHSPELIKNLIEKWKKGFEIVHTKRIDHYQKNIFKKYASKYFYKLYSAFFVKDVITGWTSLLLSVLFLGGIQLISIGILGEYTGTIFLEMKERPRYIARLKMGM